MEVLYHGGNLLWIVSSFRGSGKFSQNFPISIIIARKGTKRYREKKRFYFTRKSKRYAIGYAIYTQLMLISSALQENAALLQLFGGGNRRPGEKFRPGQGRPTARKRQFRELRDHRRPGAAVRETVRLQGELLRLQSRHASQPGIVRSSFRITTKEMSKLRIHFPVPISSECFSLNWWLN